MLSKLIRLWASLTDVLFKLIMLLTFLAVFPTLYLLFRNVFYEFEPYRAVISCIVLLTLIHANKSIQGGSL